MRNVLLLGLFLSPACLWAQTAALPVFIGQNNNLLAPTVDASGQNVVFGSPIAPDGTNFGVTDIYAVGANGSGLRQLTNLAGFTPGEAAGANNLSFSANGALAAYTEAGSGLVVPLPVPAPLPSPAPNAPTPVVPPTGQLCTSSGCISVSCTSSGGAINCTSTSTNPAIPALPGITEAIHLIDISTGVEHIVNVNTQICVLPLEAAICFGCFPPTCLNTLHLTDDGSKVLVSMSGSEPFYLVNADGTGTMNLPVYSGQLAPSPQRVISGGGQIVFVSSSASAPPTPPVPQPLPNVPEPAPVEDVYVVNLDGSNIQNVTNFQANSSLSPANATISDDGKTIAFEGIGDSATAVINTNPVIYFNPVAFLLPLATQIWVVHSDGTALAALTSGANASTQPSISGDGSLIAFVRAGQICVVHSDGTGLKVLTNFQLSTARDPVISENGSLIVFDIGPSNGGGAGALYAINSDGTNLHPVYAPRSLNPSGITGVGSGAAPSPGALFLANGANLAADSTTTAGGFPLPESLSGVSLLANGIPVPMLSVTAWQIEAQFPPELTQSPVAFQLRFADGTSPTPAAADIPSLSPVIFTLPTPGIAAPPQAAAYHAATGTPADQAHPATAGEVLEIYGTGLGSTNPVVAAGGAAPSSPPAQTLAMPQVLIGNVSAQVLFSGLTPGLAGVYQVNAVVPRGLKPGLQSVVWKIDNNTISNSGGITVQ